MRTEPAGFPVSREAAGALPSLVSPARGLDEYAAACRRVGQRVFQCQGVWWREIRPCFFRPVLPFIGVRLPPTRLPLRFAIGGYQYPAGAGGIAPNSCLAYLAFPHAQSYALENHRARRRAEVRKAEQVFHVRAIDSSAEFKAHAHPAYIDFYRRTRYAYLANRVKKSHFDRWSDAEFADPGLIALGAWAGESLSAVSLSRVVGEAWVYTTFFATDAALRQNVASLLLNHVRTLAATVQGVDFVFLSMLRPGRTKGGIEAFFVERGARVVLTPAVLQINPVSRWVLNRVRPDILRQLTGDPLWRMQSTGSSLEHAAESD